jgi:hypothetical protein
LLLAALVAPRLAQLQILVHPMKLLEVLAAILVAAVGSGSRARETWDRRRE